MPDNSDPRRDQIHALLQEMGPDGIDKASVLVGWAVVADWMDEDGERWVSRCHSASLPRWLANGLHHEALYGNWDEPEEDGDEA